MKDRELLSGSIAQDITVVLILCKDSPKSRPENTSATARAVSVDNLENSDTVAMATPNLY